MLLRVKVIFYFGNFIKMMSGNLVRSLVLQGLTFRSTNL